MEVLRNVREIADVPVIVVSARQEEQEKIQALDEGADDYVTKPFYMGELLARIRAAMRRKEKRGKEEDTVFCKDALVVDYTKRTVEVNGTEVHLTPIEYKILILLIN